MQNEHVEGYNTCAGCHNPHTLELRIDDCASCHEDADSVEGVQMIRSLGSSVDYDGDGDMEEGIKGEIETLQEMLYSAIQMYASEVVGSPIVYDSHAYPYFFVDTNENGEPDADEANYGNRYVSFTPVLVQATYNFQVTMKDPGNYAHNPDYTIQLLYDSIEAVNEQLAEGVDLSMASRDSFGHFDSGAEAFRHWDEDGVVSASCSRCHSADGLPFEIAHGVTIEQEISNSMSCTTCHESLGGEYPVYALESVEVPSGLEISFGEESPNNICLMCHQGRQSGVDIAAAISNSGAGDDETSEALRFLNPHYFGAGATFFGAQANGAYQYDEMGYNGLNEHTRQFDECSDCHNQHSAEIRFQECTDCHENVESAEDVMLIRAHPDDKDPVDYDGDGDDTEPIRDEIATFQEDLFTRIQSYATETAGAGIVYAPNYPYWFTDLNGNGEADADETERSNSYATWTPTLLRAVYNYQWSNADPGSFAHNPDYILQVLYDSLVDIGGEEAVANYTRPEVRPMDEE